MEAFQIGPFDYTPGKSRTLNGVAQTEWDLAYGDKLVGSAWVAGDRAQVVDALASMRGELTAQQQRRPNCTGAILCTTGTEIDCTFEALLGDARGELEQQVAAILFGEN